MVNGVKDISRAYNFIRLKQCDRTTPLGQYLAYFFDTPFFQDGGSQGHCKATNAGGDLLGQD